MAVSKENGIEKKRKEKEEKVISQDNLRRKAQVIHRTFPDGIRTPRRASRATEVP